jgi:hypothetical protein
MADADSFRAGEGPSSIVSKESDGAWRDNFLARGVVVNDNLAPRVREAELTQAAVARVMPVRVEGKERSQQEQSAAGSDQGEAAPPESPHGQTEAIAQQSSLDFDDLKAIQARV